MRTAPSTICAALTVGLLAGCSDVAVAPNQPPGTSSSPPSSPPWGPTPESSAGSPRPSAATVPGEPWVAEFDDASALDAWTEVEAHLGVGEPGSYEVRDGALRVVSPHVSWIDDQRGFGLAREVVGDVDVVARVSTAGVDGGPPGVDWSLAGLMLRDPTTARASWVHWTVGHVRGPVLERKLTSSGQSILDLDALPSDAPVELRMVRQGDHVVVAHRPCDAAAATSTDPSVRAGACDASAWTVAHRYLWPGRPTTVELVVTAQSGGEDDHADLVATTDYVRVSAATFSPAELARLGELDAGPLGGT